MPGVLAQVQKIEVLLPIVSGIAFVTTTGVASSTGDMIIVSAEQDLSSVELFDEYKIALQGGGIDPTNLPEAT